MIEVLYLVSMFVIFFGGIYLSWRLITEVLMYKKSFKRNNILVALLSASDNQEETKLLKQIRMRIVLLVFLAVYILAVRNGFLYFIVDPAVKA